MFKILTIPYDPATRLFNEEILTNFCLNKQIKNYKAEFFMRDGSPGWTVFLEYEPVLESGDNAETSGMNEAERLLFERLRQWRREQAEKEGVPTYIVATNREIKDIIKHTPRSLEALKAIRGFGKKKIEKYGAAVTGLIKAFYDKQ
jgi:superfamily II DNA helicase RecQ